MLSQDSEDEMWSRFVFELVIWPQKLLWQDELNPRVRCAFGNVWYLDDHYLAKAQNVPEIAEQDDWGKKPEKAWE